MTAFRDVVASHHRDSDAVLVVSREPCIRIADDERAHVSGRSFRVVAPDALDGLALRESWLLAVLLCPGDDTRLVAEWAVAGKRDPRRVLFYFHPDAEPRNALAAWHSARLPVHSTWTVRDWRSLHKHLGAHWNVRIFEDFGRRRG